VGDIAAPVGPKISPLSSAGVCARVWAFSARSLRPVELGHGQLNVDGIKGKFDVDAVEVAQGEVVARRLAVEIHDVDPVLLSHHEMPKR
jgi:hypothetical protein